MTYFVACFGESPPGFLDAVRGGLRETMGCETVGDLSWNDGAAVVYGGSARTMPNVELEGSRGWLVVQGIALDVRVANGPPQFAEFLAASLAAGKPDVDRFEGCFALAQWDSAKRQAWFLNDHASVRNLYYVERDRAVFVTTAPVVLAKVLGLELDEFGVRQLLARGCVFAPTTLFRDMQRLNVGEVGHVMNGRLEILREWIPCRDPMRCRLGESVERFTDVLTDRMRRLREVAPASIGDLTGGLDSRLINLAQHFIGGPVNVTVNGPDTDPDVIVAKRIAEAMGWPMRHFPHDEPEISGELRHELSVRTAGELPFDRISFHRVIRPRLAEEFDVRYGGSGGELLRYYTWSHEFANIGRRKRADVGRTVKYRYALFGEPPRQLFEKPWYGELQAQIAEAIGGWFDRMPGTLTTQQQDALYVWKMTSHGSLWASATEAWLRNVSPFLLRGCIDTMVAIPWRHKLSTKLQRMVNERLSPTGAAIKTVYGASGGRWGIRDAAPIAVQSYKQGMKLVKKVIKEFRRKGRTSVPRLAPFFTEEFKQFMQPANMVTAYLYDANGLRSYVTGSTEQLARRAHYLVRIATIEHIARAIGR